MMSVLARRGATSKQKVVDVRARIAAKRIELAEAQEERAICKQRFTEVEPDGRRVTEIPEFVAAEEAVRRCGRLEGDLAELKEEQARINEELSDILEEVFEVLSEIFAPTHAQEEE
jgi:chromosome segregation ATPase